MGCGDPWLFTILKTPIVISTILMMVNSTRVTVASSFNRIVVESTVITLSDWYHIAMKLGPEVRYVVFITLESFLGSDRR